MSTTRLLSAIEGITNRFNDIIYKSPKLVSPNTTNKEIVCYFGGDVQDLKTSMIDNNNNEYLEYSLENTAIVLSQKFTTSHVFAIRANRFHDKTYAIYDHFVVSDSFGCPKHQFTKQSLIHLRLLLLNCFNQLNIDLDFNRDEKIVLIAFSKGCVVLNQFLYAFYVSSQDLELKRFVSTIESMYWLDGGHSGGANTWVTAQEVLKHLAELKIRLHINVTPYQVKCRFRPWIAKEETIFVKTLTQFGANPQRVLHFADEDNCLEMHFKVIKHFI